MAIGNYPEIKSDTRARSGRLGAAPMVTLSLYVGMFRERVPNMGSGRI